LISDKTSSLPFLSSILLELLLLAFRRAATMEIAAQAVDQIRGNLITIIISMRTANAFPHSRLHNLPTPFTVPRRNFIALLPAAMLLLLLAVCCCFLLATNYLHRNARAQEEALLPLLLLADVSLFRESFCALLYNRSLNQFLYSLNQRKQSASSAEL